MKSEHMVYCIAVLAMALSAQALGATAQRSPTLPLASPLPDSHVLQQCLPGTGQGMGLDLPRAPHPAVVVTEAALDGDGDYLGACDALRAVSAELTNDARAQVALADCGRVQQQWQAALAGYLQAFIAEPRSVHGLSGLQALMDLLKSVPDLRLGIGSPRCDAPVLRDDQAPESRVAARGHALVVPRYPTFARSRTDAEPLMATVEICIQTDGHVSGAAIVQSTNRLDLDAAALTAAWLSTFVPGTIDGVAVTSKVLLPYNFSLE